MTTATKTQKKYYLGKCDYNDSGRKNCKAYLTWTWDGSRFSMCAEIWNPKETDIYCGGQCCDDVAAYFPSDVKAKRMVAVWERWHLNDMKAGSPAQEQFLRDNPINVVYPESHCDRAKDVLRKAGLEPDNGYSYGSAWLTEEIPADVVSEIESW